MDTARAEAAVRDPGAVPRRYRVLVRVRAGRLASLYGSMPLPNLFGAIAAVGIGAGIVMFALTPSIKRLMGDVN
jgi:hypothetical protein